MPERLGGQGRPKATECRPGCIFDDIPTLLALAAFDLIGARSSTRRHLAPMDPATAPPEPRSIPKSGLARC
jgi:hypothetical protein